MNDTTTDRTGHDDLGRAKYMRLVSYKRDGSAAATPVWLVPFEGGYAFTTDADAWKVRRVRANPSVTVTVCDVRGRVAPGAVEYRATAEVLDDAKVRAVQRLIFRKYWFAYSLMIAPAALIQRMRGKREKTGALKVTIVD